MVFTFSTVENWLGLFFSHCKILNFKNIKHIQLTNIIKIFV